MPEMMACEKMHARIPVATCVGRQKKGIFIGNRREGGYQHIPYECRNCEAGRAALAGNPPKIKQEEVMAVTKPCANCGRVLTIVGCGWCFICNKAAKGLVGVRRDEALAAVKAKIDRGEVKQGGGRKKKAAAETHATPPPPAPEGTAAASESATAVIAVIAGDAIASSDALSSGGLVSDAAFSPLFLLGERPAPARVSEGVPVISLDFADERDRAIYSVLITTAARLRRSPEQQIFWMLQNAIEAETDLLQEALR